MDTFRERQQQASVNPAGYLAQLSQGVRVIWYFFFFLVSGFCGILYELVWLRLAMAQFGVTTPLVSIVLSMFMAGLGLGSWAAAAFIRRYEERINFPPAAPVCPV